MYICFESNYLITLTHSSKIHFLEGTNPMFQKYPASTVLSLGKGTFDNWPYLGKDVSLFLRMLSWFPCKAGFLVIYTGSHMERQRQ